MAKDLPEYLRLNRCPHCGIDTPSLVKVWQFVSKDSSGREVAWGNYACHRCGGLILTEYNGNGTVRRQYPTAEKELDVAIPQRARVFLLQALNSHHAPSGAVLLCASAVDAMLQEKKYAEGTLNQRIDQAVKDHLLTEDMGKWAHEIRLDANAQRHADLEADFPTEQDVKRLIEFAHALAQFLFVLPARVQRGLQAAQVPPPSSDGAKP